jgi:hypothetical protein
MVFEESKRSIIEWYRGLVSKKRQERVRLAAGWFCLLAVALLYVPLAVANLIARAADCCADGYCNIPEHHHHKQKPAHAQESAPMDCGHDLSGMTSCSMDCCKDPSRPALIPGAFVLPAPAIVALTGEVLRPVSLARSLELSRFAKPLSPPPRFGFTVL